MKIQSIKNLTIVLFTAFSVVLHAQITISGKISFKNKGVKDISVTLKDTYDGATTDENGHYSFQTSEKGNQILDSNVIVFPKGVGEKEGKEFSMASERTKNRAKRKLYKRNLQETYESSW